MHTADLDSLSLLGPSLLFAAFTGVLLFASSMGSWVENWFVLRNMDSPFATTRASPAAGQRAAGPAFCARTSRA
jgi:site-specific recombinase